MLYIIDSLGRVKFVASSLGNLLDPGSNGIIVRTTAQLTIARNIVAGSTKLVVTNGDGVSGNPSIDLGMLSATDIPSLDASKITTGQLALARGGTNADLSGTGGTSKFLKQNSAGAAVTVVQPASSDLSDASNIPLINGNNHFTGTGSQTFDGTIRPATSQMFSWNIKAEDTVYQALSDGFVTGWFRSNPSASAGIIEIFSDASNPPTTSRVRVANGNLGAGIMDLSFMCPIRKGDFWKASKTSGNVTSVTVWWVPMGTAG